MEFLPAEKATPVAVGHTAPGALRRDRPPGRTPGVGASDAAARSAVALTSERQHAIADAVGKQAKAALRKATADKASTDAQGAGDTKASGTKVTRRRKQAS
jgi:hypothetical protein